MFLFILAVYTIRLSCAYNVRKTTFKSVIIEFDKIIDNYINNASQQTGLYNSLIVIN